MAYQEYAQSYIEWLQGQLDYIAGDPYTNFRIEIDPTYEVTSFTQSVDVNQQKIFHNAADDQVATLRALKEIDKTPSSYLEEYKTMINNEMNLIQASASEVENTHQTQESSDKSTVTFNATFAPTIIADFGKYQPMRIFE